MGKQLHILDVSFATREELEHEYATNIAQGGIFVETEEPLQVREKVSVRVKLRFIRKAITLKGEVVHVVGPELAAAGATPGVAVHFEARAVELRMVFEPLIAAVDDQTETVQGMSAKPARATAKPHESTEQPQGADRRAEPRSRARVRARVYCPGCEMIEGRSRDLSITGVLVSIGSAAAIGIGEPVKVRITNPETGIEREILGKVARHVRETATWCAPSVCSSLSATRIARQSSSSCETFAPRSTVDTWAASRVTSRSWGSSTWCRPSAWWRRKEPWM